MPVTIYTINIIITIIIIIIIIISIIIIIIIISALGCYCERSVASLVYSSPAEWLVA